MYFQKSNSEPELIAHALAEFASRFPDNSVPEAKCVELIDKVLARSSLALEEVELIFSVLRGYADYLDDALEELPGSRNDILAERKQVFAVLRRMRADHPSCVSE